jgi:hypothetical protein
MRPPASAKWVLLALAGLAIAIGIAVAATNLTSQQIGIASESVSAGDVLAPSLRTPEGEGNGKQGGHEGPGGKERTTPTTPAEPTSPENTTSPSEPAEPPSEGGSDDYGGNGGGDD